MSVDLKSLIPQVLKAQPVGKLSLIRENSCV